MFFSRGSGPCVSGSWGPGSVPFLSRSWSNSVVLFWSLFLVPFVVPIPGLSSGSVS